MVIRFNKATRFVLICAMLIVTALISIGTRSMSVSAPYHTRGGPVFVAVYRVVEGDCAASVSLRELEADLDHLAEGGYAVLSEQALVAALRREAALPGGAVLLLFDDSAALFETQVQPLLEERELPWFSLEQSAILTRELRAAGHSIARLERAGMFTLEEQMHLR